MKSILENAGLKVGLVGTIEVIIGDTHIHAENTTPESYVLQSYFCEDGGGGLRRGGDGGVLPGADAAQKPGSLCSTSAFFTNIEPDHIGPNEHASFEDYLHCKGLLFKQCRVGIVNGG